MRRALVGSMALHGLLVLVLLGARNSAPPAASSTASILTVELVSLAEEGGVSGARVPAPQADAPEPLSAGRAAESRERLPEPSTPDDVEPIEQSAAAAEQRSTEVPSPPPSSAEPASEAPAAQLAAAPARVERQRSPVEPQRPVPAEIPVAPPVEAVAPRPPGVPPVVPALESERLAPEADVVPAALEVASRTTLDDLPQPALARPVLPIPVEQREMLDQKISEWSEDLSALSGAELEWEHDGQAFTAEFERRPAADSVGIEQVVVAVTTEQGGSRWSTEVRMRRIAFSSFAQFVDRWDPGVQIHDDVIDGRFHSNSEIRVSSSVRVQPAFRGKVTTARGVSTSGSERPVRRDEVFLGGLETRVGRIALPDRFLPERAVADIKEARLHRFASDTRIRFHADGSYRWRPVDSAAPEQRRMLPPEPYYLIGEEGVTFHVSGVVDGKVLVYAPEDVIIEGDLVYSEDPAVAPASDDYLGLAAADDVEIAPPDVTGPGDLTVHAAIYARSRFSVRGFGAPGRATLRVYGGVAAGSVSATEPRFRTRLEFDPRLEDSRPPRFPMTDRYELVAWHGRWTAATPD